MNLEEVVLILDEKSGEEIKEIIDGSGEKQRDLLRILTHYFKGINLEQQGKALTRVRCGWMVKDRGKLVGYNLESWTGG